jgi:hypothetical protein
MTTSTEAVPQSAARKVERSGRKVERSKVAKGQKVGGHHTYFEVEKRTFYFSLLWRSSGVAASPSWLLGSPRGLCPPRLRIVTLEKNYRSTQPILAASNAVMDHARE